MAKLGISEATLRRIRDYAVEEPSFTTTFAAWDLSQQGKPITPSAVRLAIPYLLEKGVIELIEDNGRQGKVYAYKQPPNGAPPRRLFTELDASRVERIGELAPARGTEIPHTGQAIGSSGKPGVDRQRQAAGFRVKRQRQGT
jgi:hypothetical protein